MAPPYPNSQYLVTLAEVKTIGNITAVTDDAWLTSMIPYIQDAIEVYCDRRFMKYVWNEWFKFSNHITLPQHPVNTVLFIGTADTAVTVVDTTNRYSFDIKQTNGTNPTITPKLTVTDIYALTTTDFEFETITNVQDLVTLVAATFPTLTLTINPSTDYDFTTMNTLNLKSGTGLDWYGSVRQDVLYRIDDASNRTLVIPNNMVLRSSILGDWYYDDVNIIWDSGYTTATVPYALKMVAANLLRDILNISNLTGAGLLKSETITNYSYTMFDGDNSGNIAKLIQEKYALALNNFKKVVF